MTLCIVGCGRLQEADMRVIDIELIVGWSAEGAVVHAAARREWQHIISPTYSRQHVQSL